MINLFFDTITDIFYQVRWYYYKLPVAILYIKYNMILILIGITVNNTIYLNYLLILFFICIIYNDDVMNMY